MRVKTCHEYEKNGKYLISRYCRFFVLYILVFRFRFALPMNQQGNGSTHQQDCAGHADGGPVSVNNGFQHLADQQEAETGGDAFRDRGAAEFHLAGAQVNNGTDNMVQDDQGTDDLQDKDTVMNNDVKNGFRCFKHG